MPELTYREAVRDALSTAMRQDDDVFIMGEDIAEMGGSMGVTAGMLDEFGKERVRNTPISEMALAGTAIGAAMQGMRPVAEIMYEDFMTLAAELIEEPLRDAHRAAHLGDVLAHDEDVVVLTHRVGQSLPNGGAVRQLRHRCS